VWLAVRVIRSSPRCCAWAKSIEWVPTIRKFAEVESAVCSQWGRRGARSRRDYSPFRASASALHRFRVDEGPGGCLNAAKSSSHQVGPAPRRRMPRAGVVA
jgi:hypothetical protein